MAVPLAVLVPMEDVLEQLAPSRAGLRLHRRSAITVEAIRLRRRVLGTHPPLPLLAVAMTALLGSAHHPRHFHRVRHNSGEARLARTTARPRLVIRLHPRRLHGTTRPRHQRRTHRHRLTTHLLARATALHRQTSTAVLRRHHTRLFRPATRLHRRLHTPRRALRIEPRVHSSHRPVRSTLQRLVVSLNTELNQLLTSI